MPLPIVSDTSCLIILDKVGELYLLEKLFKSVITTPTVADEYNKPLPERPNLTLR